MEVKQRATKELTEKWNQGSGLTLFRKGQNTPRNWDETETRNWVHLFEEGPINSQGTGN